MREVIELQALSLAHAPLMVEGALESVSEINPWMDWCNRQFDVETARQFISEQIDAKRSGAAYEFALFNDQGVYLGGGGVNSIDHRSNRANIGYWIRSSQTRNGYGTAALEALVGWARAHTRLNRLEVVVATGNLASQRVAQKGGATWEGVAKSRLYNNGEYLDAHIYAFTRDA
ncbi:MAG: GNAT family protein [Pseudomonadota bacterium]